jgi:hypothetical protein
MLSMRAAVTGAAFVLEDAEAAVALEMTPGLAQRAPVVASADATGVVSARDRRILAKEDLCGIYAADLARRDAAWDPAASLGRTACMVVGSGKHTIARDLSTYRRQFQSAHGTFDSRAMRDAVGRGEASIDPLDLLLGLDNSVIWWTCRTYQIGEINLQITQVVDADRLALLEALATLSDRECERVLVGCIQTADQARVALADTTWPSEPVRSGPSWGGAIFVVLESWETAKMRSAPVLGELRAEPGDDAGKSGKTGAAVDAVAPGLRGLFQVLRSAREDGPPRAVDIGGGALARRGMPHIVFERVTL